PQVVFRDVSRTPIPTDDAKRIVYEESTLGLQIRPNGSTADGRPRYQVIFWYHGNDPGVTAPVADWFWKESLRYFQDKVVKIETVEEHLVYPAGTALIQDRPVEPSAADG